MPVPTQAAKKGMSTQHLLTSALASAGKATGIIALTLEKGRLNKRALADAIKQCERAAAELAKIKV